MAYDEELAARIREAVRDRAGLVEKAMFGGVAWMLHGNMVCGVVKSDLMLRVGPAAHADALAKPHARPMDFAGRPMLGYVYVAPEGVRTSAQLATWLQRALDHVSALPAKVKDDRPRNTRKTRS